MYVGSEFIKTSHYRTSKTGKVHAYLRRKTVIVFRCDSCQEVFRREKGKIDPKRLNNNFYHVCSNCDAKRFAQEKGVEARRIWDMPVSSLKTIGSYD
jgi:hypothetical protein